MSRPRLFTGGITDDALRTHLAKLIGCDPMTDNHVLLWAAWRRRISHARRHAKENASEPHLTQQQRWAIEQGWPRPRDSASSPEQGIPDYGRGRPMPRGMHFADKYLLQMFPKLLKKSLSFAGLERLHHVDYVDKDDPESVLLPTPEEWQRLPTDWDTQSTGHHVLVKVRNRSKDRIRAALAQQGIPGVPDGLAPHARREERLPGEPSAEEMGKIFAALPTIQRKDIQEIPGYPPDWVPPEWGDAVIPPGLPPWYKGRRAQTDAADVVTRKDEASENTRTATDECSSGKDEAPATQSGDESPASITTTTSSGDSEGDKASAVTTTTQNETSEHDVNG